MFQKTFSRMASVSIAFVIFGFIDNFLMVIFGERIDTFFVSIGVSNTLLAAGLGNTLSDAVGILTGRWVEKVVHAKLSTPDTSDLTKTQTILAEAAGIIIGCLLGLFPILFFD